VIGNVILIVIVDIISFLMNNGDGKLNTQNWDECKGIKIWSCWMFWNWIRTRIWLIFSNESQEQKREYNTTQHDTTQHNTTQHNTKQSNPAKHDTT
jgi:hypothetical protein